MTTVMDIIQSKSAAVIFLIIYSIEHTMGPGLFQVKLKIPR